MTDTKAPERIYLLEEDIEEFKDTHPVEGSTCFIPYDLHLALVAAAYENAAEKAEFCVENPEGESVLERKYAIGYRILSSTPTDAQAARDARDKQMREAAVRHAEKAEAERDEAIAALSKEGRRRGNAEAEVEKAEDHIRAEIDRANVKQAVGFFTNSERNAVVDAMGRVQAALRDGESS
jgi:flagellar biosynthesis/type III secretory pathway protein FliH